MVLGNMSSLWLLLVTGLLYRGYAYQTSDEDDGGPMAETRTYRDSAYMILPERVTWEEADVICLSHKARLAVVDSMGKAAFLAEVMTDSPTLLQDVWLGARSSHRLWMWTSTEETLPSRSLSSGYPPWVARPEGSRDSSKDCLAMARDLHGAPLFVNLDCRLQRSFICEKNHRTEDGRPIPSRWVRANGSSFLLYHGHLTWDDAVAFCRKRNLRLAVLPGVGAAGAIGRAMKYTRPDFESVWIGASSRYGPWLWVSTGEPLVGPGLPSWSPDGSDKSGDCAVLDRHGSRAEFVQTGCDRRRDFVCEQYSVQDESSWIPDEVIFEHYGRQMVLHVEDKTWNEASDTCVANGSRLVTVRDTFTIQVIMKAMAEHPNEPKHAWLGAALRNGSWVWTSTGEGLPSTPDGNGFPPWYELDKELTSRCLNMDRLEDGKAMFYGLGCRNKQPFVCEVDCNAPGLVPHGDWSCSNGTNTFLNSCDLSCGVGYILSGSNSVRCTPNGWTGQDKSRSFPRCLSAKSAARHIARLVNSYEPLPMLFLVDELKVDGGFRSALQFISGVLRACRSRPRRAFGLVSLPSKQAVMLPLRLMDPCEVLEVLPSLEQDSKVKHGLAFDQGMKLAREQIAHTQGGNRTMIFFLTDKITVGHQKTIMEVIKEEGHVVVAINMNNERFGNVPSVATTGTGNHLNFFGFQDLKDFTHVSVHVTADNLFSVNCSADPLLPGLDLKNVHVPNVLLQEVP